MFVISLLLAAFQLPLSVPPPRLARVASAAGLCAPAEPPSEPAAFDLALGGLLSDAADLGSVDAAVDKWLPRLGESFIPELGARIEGAPSDAPDLSRWAELMSALQLRVQGRFEAARDTLKVVLEAGEINAMDARLSKLVREGEADAGLFYVLARNLADAEAAGDDDGVKLLSHLHTRLQVRHARHPRPPSPSPSPSPALALAHPRPDRRLARPQEELEKRADPALALLHKLTRTDDAGIRGRVLREFLVPKTSATLPDGSQLPLASPAPAAVAPLQLAGAIDTALSRVLEMALDDELVRETAEGVRQVAKEAREVVADARPASALPHPHPRPHA